MKSLPPDEMPEFETLCAHWGEDRTRYLGAVTPPIFQNSLFTTESCEARYGTLRDPEFYDYTRMENPTTQITEAKVAVLEKAERARCFGSGMGAISAAILSCVKSGDHVVAVETIYGPTRQFFKDYLTRFGISHTLVDGEDPQEFADALRPNTTLIYLESPSSIVFKQQDLAAVAAIARAHGAKTICDNSWASPVFQNPLEFGIDMVVHSATKYLGGHSDIVAGVAAGSEACMIPMIHNEGHLLGSVLDPFASWLMMRGIRTLPIRLERHQKTTVNIANALLDHPLVDTVYYPGIRTDRQCELTRKQLRGTSGLLSVQLKPQDRESSYKFVDSLRYFGIGCSWGGFESLALPMTIPPRLLGREGDKHAWIIRMFFGLENENDLWNDIEHSLTLL